MTADEGTRAVGDGRTRAGRDPGDPAAPTTADIQPPAAVVDDADATGCVVWHRKHLRVADQRALADATASADVVCPLFVFDPSFYGGDGLACDARLRLFTEAVASLNRRYAAANGRTRIRRDPDAMDHLAAAATPLATSHTRSADEELPTDALASPDEPGVTLGYGDPVEVLSRFVDRGWTVVTMATPTSRYGRRRDERIRSACGDAVRFVSGDGIRRGEERPRTNWQSHAESWLTATQQAPSWRDPETTRFIIDTGITPAAVDAAFAITPTKTQVPPGTHRAATAALHEFVDRIRSYPGSISAPQDAREGTSGLSPYLTFGLLSVRQVYQYVTEHAPSCRGRELFTSRLYWNLHYNQKLADWPGWTDQAVNPVYADRNEPHHDPALVDAWKRGETGFPMVDASMRCLRETGWLNFRMRAMCASVFAHILHQPWWIGADWYHHHLVDSDVGINYTQWQSQAGLIGKPSQRVYNPRKQVRDQDPDGEWIRKWVPELADLPPQFLDRPERTPVAVQRSCGVHIGETYPRPVVDFDARREAFWTRHKRNRAAAARELRRPEIAKRASFAGGHEAAAAIAAQYGEEDPSPTQLSLSEVDEATEQSEQTASRPRSAVPNDFGDTTVPTGVGDAPGEPSPDDRAVTGRPSNRREHETEPDRGEDTASTQTTVADFE